MELFNDDFVIQLREKPRGRAAWAVPELYRTAMAPDRDAQRGWMRSTLGSLSDPGKSKLKARLESHRDFGMAYNELCLAAVLLETGNEIEYEPDVYGTTPDFIVRSHPPVLVELWTRSRPDAVKAANRRWEVLAELVNEIPVPAAVMIVGPSREFVKAPDSRMAKIVAGSLREWLLRGAAPSVHKVAGYEFVVFDRMPGLYAGLAPPYGGGQVTSDIVVSAISEKISRYRSAANELGSAMIVVLTGEPSAALDLNLLESALAGKQAMSISFSVGTPGLLSKTTLPLRAVEKREEFDPVLSAIGWLSIGISAPGDLTIIPALGAARPVGELTSPHIRTHLIS